MHARLIGAVVVAAVVGSAATAWAASAANPVNKSTGVIAACYATSGGALRVATTPCKATETAVSWQIGAVPLRADIAAGAPDAQLLSKDGLKMRLACYVNPEVCGPPSSTWCRRAPPTSTAPTSPGTSLAPRGLPSSG